MNFVNFLNHNYTESWIRLLSVSKYASPFQTPAFYDLLKKTDGFHAEVFALSMSGSIKVLAVVTIMKEPGIKGFFSRRGIIFGGPLIHEARDEELIFFLQKLKQELKNKIIYVETRNFFDYANYKNAFIKSNWQYDPYINFQLPIINMDKKDVVALFKYNRRREIRQSIENGTIYYICTTMEEVLSIYKILKDLYKERVKVPLPSPEYFLGLFNNNIMKAFIVKHNKKTIGGAFCPVISKKAIYTYYYCGLRNYNKKIFPTHIAVLAAIEYAIENNIPMVDFMGAGKPDVEYGVRKYKSEFGGILVEHGRFIKVLNPFLFILGKLGLKILTKIK